MASLADKWVTGTTNVKKSNAIDHISKSTLHKTASYHAVSLQKKAQTVETPAAAASTSSESSNNANNTSSSVCDLFGRQTTIPELTRAISLSQAKELTMKFQLAHFLTVKCKPLQDFETFINFEKDVHKVKLGSGYLDRRAATSMVSYLAKNIIQEEVTAPLNSGDCTYFSLFYDGSSSAKTMDEKEVYVIKTCKEGKASFQVISLEEPEATNAAGLKKALDRSLKKLNFQFDRKNRQIGNGSDGASVNTALFALEKEELGDHLIKGWCANHKCELALHDSFRISKLNTECEDILSNIFYFFRKANLKWRLFKQQAKSMELKQLKFQRASGSRWVSHQVEATSNFLRNLPILLGFLHQQTLSPYNKTMKDAKSTMVGHLKNVSKLTSVVYLAVRQDILAYISPFSQALESRTILVPAAITSMKNAISVMARISQILQEKGGAAFYMEELFPTLSKMVWPYLTDTDDDAHRETMPGRTTRQDEIIDELSSKPQQFHGYNMTGSLDPALEKVSVII